MIKKLPKELKRYLKLAKDQGFRVENTANHLRFLSPAGAIVVVAGTPSDHRAFMNIRADLRRAGLKVD